MSVLSVNARGAAGGGGLGQQERAPRGVVGRVVRGYASRISPERWLIQNFVIPTTRKGSAGQYRANWNAGQQSAASSRRPAVGGQQPAAAAAAAAAAKAERTCVPLDGAAPAAP